MADGLVIFDCDGVLVDSEMISSRVLRALLKRASVDVDDQFIFSHFLGRSMKTIIGLIDELFDVQVTKDQLAGLNAEILDIFDSELNAVPGIDGALSAIGGDKCVASSSFKDRIEHSLKLTGIRPHFGEHIFSATMVKRGKPFPDLFLFAAEKMGYAPEQCVVIEDSAAGLQAAQSAGMRCVGFSGGSHSEAADLERKLGALSPDMMIDHMDKLPEVLKLLGVRK